jgi:tetratricopeptide (TPR) repeat protein
VTLADQALLLAWAATAHWLRGDAKACRALADDAMARARRSDDDRALAAAHTVRALVAAYDGDRLANDTHYLRALDRAEAAGDLLQVIRIRLNRGSRLNEEGFYDEAVTELDLAIGHADLGGYAAFKAIALGNRGEARYHPGQFDHALDDLEVAKSIFQRLGSPLVATRWDRRGTSTRPGGRRRWPAPPSPKPWRCRAPRATSRAWSPAWPGWPGCWPTTTRRRRGRRPTRRWRPARASARSRP